MFSFVEGGITGLPARRPVVPRVVPVVCFNMIKSYAHDWLNLGRCYYAPDERANFRALSRSSVTPKFTMMCAVLALLGRTSQAHHVATPKSFQTLSRLVVRRRVCPADSLQCHQDNAACAGSSQQAAGK